MIHSWMNSHENLPFCVFCFSPVSFEIHFPSIKKKNSFNDLNEGHESNTTNYPWTRKETLTKMEEFSCLESIEA